MSVGGVQRNVGYNGEPVNTGEILNNSFTRKTEDVKSGKTEETSSFSGFEVFDADDYGKDTKAVEPDAYKEKLKTIGKSHSHSSLISWIGRIFQSVANVFKRIAAPSVEKYQNNHVVDYSNVKTGLTNVAKDVSAITMEHVALAMKLDVSKINGEKICFDDLSKSIDNAGLKDIVQRAAVQDCWFLSSVGAVLRSKGPQYIKQLFSEGKEGFVDVQLGRKKYSVPLQKLQCDGKNIFSDSAPWVNALECAMQMKILDTSKSNSTPASKDVSMDFKTAGEALAALIPDEISSSDTRILNGKMSREEKLNFIKNHLNNNDAVVMGNNGAMGGIFTALSTDIAGGHLVTVLAADDKNVTVLDPYGRITNVGIDKLDAFEAYSSGDNVFNSTDVKENTKAGETISASKIKNDNAVQDNGFDVSEFTIID